MLINVIVLYSTVPGMPLLTVTPSEDGSALLKWQPPPAGVSPVLGYRLSYGQADPTSDSFMVQELDSEKRSYNVSSLSAGVLYVFQLAARTIWGYGSSAQITLLTPNIVQTTTDDMVTAPGTTDAQNVSVQEAIPLLANLTAESINSSSVILRWEPPKSSDRIQGYRVWFAVTYSNGTDIAMESDVSEATVILNGLRPNTEYVARVCMLSKHGPGPYSLPISIKTQPAQEGRTHVYPSHTQIFTVRQSLPKQNHYIFITLEECFLFMSGHILSVFVGLSLLFGGLR